MRQMGIHELTARARKTDPGTSHEAAKNVERKGSAKAARLLCLAAVKERPGLTAAEVATACDLERHVPSRRLPELREAGLVENGPARPCTVTGNRSITWWPEGEGI